jgi:hypothetical protein
MIGRLRLLVPSSLILGAALGFSIVEGAVFLVEWQLPVAFMPEVKTMAELILVNALGILYGGHRAIAVHPDFDAGYRKWLATTPWTVRKPLPMGPVHLVWEDGVVVGTLILASLWLQLPGSIRIAERCAFVNMALLVLSFWGAEMPLLGYAGGFSLGLVLLLWNEPWLCLATTAACCLLVQKGIWLSLEKFPWEREHKYSPGRCGWPFDHFFEVAGPPMKAIRAILFSLHLGWWFFIILGFFPVGKSNTTPDAIIPALLGALPLAALRWHLYGFGYKPPITLAGRIATARWIIPSFDVVLVGPISTILGALAVIITCIVNRVPANVSFALTITVSMLFALLSPPGLRAWQLTGGHRMVPGRQSDKEFVRTN